MMTLIITSWVLEINHCTASCTHVFKQTVNYYVFCAFIDINKAFDNVDYWLLFGKLINKSANTPKCFATCLLAYWYSNQKMKLRWQGCLYFIYNEQRCTPRRHFITVLFHYYARDVIASITALKYGCNIGGTFVNILMYADDMVLLAPSWNALQFMLNKLEYTAHSLNMTINTKNRLHGF